MNKEIGAIRDPLRFQQHPCILCGQERFKEAARSRVQMLLPTPGQRLPEVTFARCENCGLVQQAPWIPEGHIGEFYGANYLPYQDPSSWGRYQKYVGQSLKQQDRRRVDILKKHLGPQPTGAILDVGCGHPSFLLELLRQRPGERAIGVDLSGKGWESLKTPPNLKLWQGQLANFKGQLPDLSAVTMWHYLEHDYHPLESLKLVYQALRPGGVLVVEVPDYSSLSRQIFRGAWAGYHTPRHTAAYSPDALAKLIKAAGFSIIHHRRYGTMQAYTLWWLSQLERGRKRRYNQNYLFWSYVRGATLFGPLHYLERLLPLGLQLCIARKESP